MVNRKVSKAASGRSKKAAPSKSTTADRRRGRSGGLAGGAGYDFQDIYVALQLAQMLTDRGDLRDEGAGRGRRRRSASSLRGRCQSTRENWGSADETRSVKWDCHTARCQLSSTTLVLSEETRSVSWDCDFSSRARRSSTVPVGVGGDQISQVGLRREGTRVPVRVASKVGGDQISQVGSRLLQALLLCPFARQRDCCGSMAGAPGPTITRRA
jgi:hypothetical protein